MHVRVGGEYMAWHRFTLGGSQIKGFRVLSDGVTEPFEGTLRHFYSDVGRASQAARRKYHDQTITVTEIRVEKKKYRVDEERLLEIAEEIK